MSREKENCLAGVGERVGVAYSINGQLASDRAFETPKVNENMLSVWHSGLVHADRDAITKMAQSGAGHGLDITAVHRTNNCSPCVEGTITSMSVSVRTNLET